MTTRRPGESRVKSPESGVPDDQLLLVGIVRRPHGRSGEVSVEVTTSFPERFTPGLALTWRREAEERRLTVSGARPHGKRLLICFEGVCDMEGARELAGGDLLVARENAAPAPEGFFYEHEIAGWRCEDPRGLLLGTVASLGTTSAGPMLELDTPLKKGALVPFVQGIVVRVDRAARRIVLDPPEGLFDL
ncbi:MAG: ribosome maturation factor RimM [Thermoanaerobaculia bacterium]